MKYSQICKLLTIATLASSCTLVGEIEIREAKWGKDVTAVIKNELKKQGGNSLKLANKKKKIAWQSELFKKGSPSLEIRYFDGKQEKTINVKDGEPLNLVSAPKTNTSSEEKEPRKTFQGRIIDDSLSPKIIQAVDENDENMVEELLEKGIDPRVVGDLLNRKKISPDIRNMLRTYYIKHSVIFDDI